MIALIIAFCVAHLAIASLAFWMLGHKYIRNGYNNSFKFKIVSKMDFIRCTFGGLLWPVTLVLFTGYYVMNIFRNLFNAWNELPMYNPKKLGKDNEI